MTISDTRRVTMTRKVGALLAKAASTTSQAEAEALASKAQALASRHAIDLSVARYQHDTETTPEVPEERELVVGFYRTLTLPGRVDLWAAVARGNDIRWSIAHDKTVVYPLGMPSDLDVAERLWEALVDQMERLSAEWVKAGSWKGETYWSEPGWRGYTYKPARERPITAAMARRSYINGFTTAVGDRIKAARDDAIAEATERAEAVGEGALSVLTLALRDKEQVIEEARKKAWEARGVRGSMRRSVHAATSPSATAAGWKAGASASMSHRTQISA